MLKGNWVAAGSLSGDDRKQKFQSTLWSLAKSVASLMSMHLNGVYWHISDLPVWNSSINGKAPRESTKLLCLRSESSSSTIDFVINLFHWKSFQIFLVLSCSFSFPAENIFFRFIFHLFYSRFVYANQSGRGNIMRSFCSPPFRDFSSDVVGNWK